MIICDINLFSRDQQIFMSNEKGESENLGKCPIEELSKILVQFCYQYNNSKIHLFGNQMFITELIPQIQEINNITYSNKLEINIEVN